MSLMTCTATMTMKIVMTALTTNANGEGSHVKHSRMKEKNISRTPCDEHTQETQEQEAAKGEVDQQLNRQRQEIKHIPPELEEAGKTTKKADQFSN